MTRHALLLAMVTLPLLGTAGAAEMRSVSVDYSHGRYTMESEVWFDATVEQVYEVFRRWDRSTQFSSTIIEARDIEADEQGRPGYYIRHQGCVLFFCKTIERNGHLELKPHEEMRAYADPERSDFEFANEVWTFAPEDGGTLVSYHLLMKPKFWLPPGIGPYMIKRKLKSGGGDAIDRMEVIAQGLPLEPGLIVD